MLIYKNAIKCIHGKHLDLVTIRKDERVVVSTMYESFISTDDMTLVIDLMKTYPTAIGEGDNAIMKIAGYAIHQMLFGVVNNENTIMAKIVDDDLLDYLKNHPIPEYNGSLPKVLPVAYVYTRRGFVPITSPEHVAIHVTTDVKDMKGNSYSDWVIMDRHDPRIQIYTDSDLQFPRPDPNWYNFHKEGSRDTSSERILCEDTE